MLEPLKKVYRKIKYGFFTTPQKEYINFHKRRQQTLLDAYRKTNAVRKLQIGAQSNSIEGWLNVDILPKANTVAYMDATETFPFESNSLDYVFSEHMIEHVSYEGARKMLQECYRTLKPGGKIRIATPDLQTVVRVLTDSQDAAVQRYIRFYVDRFVGPTVPYDPAQMVNTLFYQFGHQFIYNESSLSHALQQAGFTQVRRCAVGVSDDPMLRNVEQHMVEMGEANNALETMILEATK
jgi:predicted SAM-dependent methyltransferase